VGLNVDSLEKTIIPDVLRIDVTNACNNKCIFCGNRKMSRPISFIRECIVKKALTQGYDMGIKKASFYATGDPFLHPQLSNFVSLAKEIGFEYAFTNTNGANVSREALIKVVESGIDSIAFSINAINSCDYILIHGKDGLDDAMKNLAWLYGFRESGKSDFNLFVSFIKTSLTNYDEREIKAFFLGKCDEVKIQNVQNIGGFCPEIDFLGVSESDLYFHYEIPCRIPFKSIILTCEGYLTACSVDFQNYLVYADLNFCDMAEAWNNKIMTDLRKRHLSKDVKGLICDNCANNSKLMPCPLIPSHATGFEMEDIFDNNEMESRIREWEKKSESFE
jgi:hypothetical protein